MERSRRSHRTRRSHRPAPGMSLLGLGLVCLLAATCQPGASDGADPARGEAASGLTLTVREQGPPALNGADQPLGGTLDTLRASDEAVVVRLPAGVDHDRLWELFALLEEQLPPRRVWGIGVELPRASGEGYEHFAEPPVFLILTAEGEVHFSTDGSGRVPLVSVDDVFPLAAGEVAGDTATRFVLVPEDGAPADLTPRVLELLRRGRAENLYLMEGDGIRPLPPAADDKAAVAAEDADP